MASQVQHVIPRTIYGTFLEPIGSSIYGGVWAQVLQNPSFEENPLERTACQSAGDSA